MKKIERQIDLIAFLLSQRLPVSVENILTEVAGYGEREFDAARRMFFRDLAELAEEGVEIESVTNPATGETGFMLKKDQYYLPQIDFEKDEARALSLLSVFLEDQPLFLYREDLKTALMKIYFDVPLDETATTNFKKQLPMIVNLGRSDSEKLPSLLKQLETAIRKKKTVMFTYFTLGTRKTTRRQVDPYGLYYTRGDWYLIGYCHTREAIRTFKVLRIRGELKLKNKDKAQNDFVVPASFAIEDYFKPMRWEYGDESVQFKVWFSLQLAGWAKKSLPEIVAVQDFADGSSEIVFQVADQEAFLDWLLSLGEDALLLEPESLQQEIVARLRAIERVYA